MSDHHTYKMLELVGSSTVSTDDAIQNAIAPQPLVADDLRAGRLVAPWGFSETPAQLALWVPKRAADGRAQSLAMWLKNELKRSGTP